MSFSNEFIDKIPSLIVPDFASATQISEREALRLAVSALPEADRRGADQRLAHAEEHGQLMRAHYAVAEGRYVDAQLKLVPEHRLSLGEAQSYEDRVNALKHDFARSKQGRDLRASIAERETALWGLVAARVARAKAEPARSDPEPRKTPDVSRQFGLAHDA